MLEKIFKLKQNNTTVKTEILAGLTTFMTMAYIIALNPNLLILKLKYFKCLSIYLPPLYTSPEIGRAHV